MAWLSSMLQSLFSLRLRWLGLIAGMIVWLIWMVFGFWATVLLVILGGLGFILGRVFEEHKSWRDIVDKLLSDRYME